MGLCETSNFSIFTVINASDLKFCPRSYSSCVHLMMRFKGSNGKLCKMMTSHFGTLCLQYRLKRVVFQPNLKYLHVGMSFPWQLTWSCFDFENMAERFPE